MSNQRPSSPGLDAILGVTFPVLDHGSITVVDYMGNDESVVRFARASTGATSKGYEDDERLIRFLFSGAYQCRSTHSGPFEAGEITLHIKAPVVVWWQLVRHRTHSRNLESGRYKELEWLCMETAPDAWRLQSRANKQGSSGFVTEWPEGIGRVGGLTAGEYLSHRESELLSRAREIYEERLDFGVAREQARKEVPFSLYYEGYDKVDLWNLFGFLGLRMDGHAQDEIRAYADVIGREIAAAWVPRCWRAFLDYRVNSLTLSAIDIEVARKALETAGPGSSMVERALSAIENKRERDECRAKFVRLGLLSE